MTERRVIVDHVLFVIEDLDASRRLYTAALARIGFGELYVQEDCVSYGADGLDDFTICRGSPVRRSLAAPSITPNSDVTLCGSFVPQPQPVGSTYEK